MNCLKCGYTVIFNRYYGNNAGVRTEEGDQ